ncbi:MAG: hypothetical protein J7L21_07035, partial [Sulfurimonas sp.]|nr:hypothetical protein [Sulfurimonas sp.]
MVSFAKYGLAALVAFSVYAAQVAEKWQSSNARMRLVTFTYRDWIVLQDKLLRTAQDTRMEYAKTVNLFTDMSVAMTGMGVGPDELIETVKVINQSIALTGDTAASSSAALTQFVQAVGTDWKSAGQEIASIREQAKGLYLTIIRGLEKTQKGFTAGMFKKWAEEGKLSAVMIQKAIASMSDEVQKKFLQIPLTIGQAFTYVNNQFGALVNTLNQSIGLTSILSAGLKSLSHMVFGNPDVEGDIEAKNKMYAKYFKKAVVSAFKLRDAFPGIIIQVELLYQEMKLLFTYLDTSIDLVINSFEKMPDALAIVFHVIATLFRLMLIGMVKATLVIGGQIAAALLSGFVGALGSLSDDVLKVILPGYKAVSTLAGKLKKEFFSGSDDKSLVETLDSDTVSLLKNMGKVSPAAQDAADRVKGIFKDLKDSMPDNAKAAAKRLEIEEEILKLKAKQLKEEVRIQDRGKVYYDKEYSALVKDQLKKQRAGFDGTNVPRDLAPIAKEIKDEFELRAKGIKSTKELELAAIKETIALNDKKIALIKKGAFDQKAQIVHARALNNIQLKQNRGLLKSLKLNLDIAKANKANELTAENVLAFKQKRAAIIKENGGSEEEVMAAFNRKVGNTERVITAYDNAYTKWAAQTQVVQQLDSYVDAIIKTKKAKKDKSVDKIYSLVSLINMEIKAVEAYIRAQSSTNGFNDKALIKLEKEKLKIAIKRTKEEWRIAKAKFAQGKATIDDVANAKLQHKVAISADVDAMADEQQKVIDGWNEVADSIAESFSNVFDSWMDGDLQGAFAGLFGDLTQEVIKWAVTSIMQSEMVSTALGISAVVNQASTGDPYTAWARMAAMAATLAALGIAVAFGGGGAGISEAEMTAAKGDVYDNDAVSDILESIEDINKAGLVYTQSMEQSLRVLVQNAGRASAVLGNGLDGGDYIAKNNDTIWGGTFREMVSTGVKIEAASLQEITNGTIQGYKFITEKVTKEKWFGLSSSEKLQTKSLGDLPTQFAEAYTEALVQGIDAVNEAAQVLGMSENDIIGFTQAYATAAKTLNFEGMDADERTALITEALGADMDAYTEMLIPLTGYIEDFKLAGESASETLVRLAVDFEVVTSAFKDVGIVLGTAAEGGLEMAESITRAYGSAQEFQKFWTWFTENFFTEVEQAEMNKAKLEASFAGMGMELPATKAAFKAMMLQKYDELKVINMQITANKFLMETEIEKAKLQVELGYMTQEALIVLIDNWREILGKLKADRTVMEKNLNTIAGLTSELGDYYGAAEKAAEAAEEARLAAIALQKAIENFNRSIQDLRSDWMG